MPIDDQQEVNAARSPGTLNNPEIEGKKIVNKPIVSGRQAYEVVRRFQRDNLWRATKNKSVADAYNESPPYDQSALDETGQGWRANFSTSFLSSIVDRVTPKFIDTVNQMKFLTYSELPDEYQDAESKTLLFRTKTTDRIRSWTGFPDYVAELAQENVLFGWTCSAHIDPHNWRPRAFKQDQMLLDEQARNHAGQVEVVCLLLNYYIHELADVIHDPEVSEEAGWNVENVKWAIEKAMPPKESIIYQPRQLSDMVREGTFYFSYHRASKMIQVAHVYVVNYDKGSVDHWIVNRNPVGGPQGSDDPYELFHAEDVVPSLEDVLTLFSLQIGNQRLYGSKGLGRLLINLAIATNRARNCFVDQCYLSGMQLANMEEKDMNTFQTKLVNPFFVCPNGMVLSAQRFQAAPEAFMALDNKLTAIAEIIAGAFIPSDINPQTGEQPTATAVSIDAAKEAEVKQGILNRWWGQITKAVGAIQRRMYSVGNISAALTYLSARNKAIADKKRLVTKRLYEMLVQVDPKAANNYSAAPNLGEADQEAVETIVDLLEAGFTATELLVIANTDSSEQSQNVNAAADAALIQFAQYAVNNPRIDQDKLWELLTEISCGFSRAKELYIPPPVESQTLESGRLQMLEFASMFDGQKIPVSPRDMHTAHLDAIQAQIYPMLQAMAAVPPAAIDHGAFSALSNVLAKDGHAMDHIQNMIRNGMVKEAQPYAQALQVAQQQFAVIQQKMQQFAQSQMQPQGAGLPPGSPPGLPPVMGVTGNGQQIPAQMPQPNVIPPPPTAAPPLTGAPPGPAAVPGGPPLQ